MKAESSKVFEDVLIFTPTLYKDDRGHFFESYNQIISEKLNVSFLQENHSVSNKNVIRGLHYQWDKPNGKLCRVVRGVVIDYIVDIRKDSPTFGKYDSLVLSYETNTMVWIPPGFAHGFISLSDDTHFIYKCTSNWNKYGEGSINPFDLDINIYFPITADVAIMSDKDRYAQSLSTYLLDPKF